MTFEKYANPQGEFIRQASQFRNIISTSNTVFPSMKNRYHLYISWACPWAHRTVIMRALKGLEKVIGLTVVHCLMTEEGWRFDDKDPITGHTHLKQLYQQSDPEYQGRYTVPVLYDKETKKIVNNESSEIIHMFNSGFNDFSENPEIDIYPMQLRGKIDQYNEWIYDTVNNGVYKTGFATEQSVYEKHCRDLFHSMDRLETILAQQKYLCGETMTEADIRLWTTILRFDPVYHGHFKCNLKSLTHNYPYLLTWCRRVYQKFPKIKETVHMDHIKKHYYMSHNSINPNHIVPLYDGPDLTVPVDI